MSNPLLHSESNFKALKQPKFSRCVTYKNNWMKVYIQGKLTGKLKILDLNEPACYISHFHIQETFRNQGHGQYLFEAAAEFAKMKGCSAISLHCSKSNLGALRFYIRNNLFIAATTVKSFISMETGKKEPNYFLTKKL